MRQAFNYNIEKSTRVLKFGRWGLMENPIGYQVTWKCRDRIFLADVVGMYRCETRSCTMLQCRHFNGESVEVTAGVVRVLDRTRPEWTTRKP